MRKTLDPILLGLDITVFHPDREISEGQRKANDEATDSDGHFISYMVTPMDRIMACRVTLSCGTHPQEAVTILRTLADRIERHGPELVNLGVGRLGHFDSNGNPVDDFDSLEPSNPGNRRGANDADDLVGP